METKRKIIRFISLKSDYVLRYYRGIFIIFLLLLILISWLGTHFYKNLHYTNMRNKIPEITISMSDNNVHILDSVKDVLKDTSFTLGYTSDIVLLPRCTQFTTFYKKNSYTNDLYPLHCIVKNPTGFKQDVRECQIVEIYQTFVDGESPSIYINKVEINNLSIDKAKNFFDGKLKPVVFKSKYDGVRYVEYTYKFKRDNGNKYELQFQYTDNLEGELEIMRFSYSYVYL